MSMLANVGLSAHRASWLGWRLAALALGASLALWPLIAAAQEEEEGGGIAALGISLPGLIAQLVNFALLLVILRIFLWGPVLRIIGERRRRIEEGLRQAEEASSAAQASQAEAREIVEEARAQARQLNAQAQESAAALRADLEARAREQAQQIVDRAREEIAMERDQAIQELRAEFADLTIRAAERVISQSLDRQAHQRLIDEVLLDSEFGAAPAR